MISTAHGKSLHATGNHGHRKSQKVMAQPQFVTVTRAEWPNGRIADEYNMVESRRQEGQTARVPAAPAPATGESPQ